MVLIASEQKLMMMRPYQVYAVKQIVDTALRDNAFSQCEAISQVVSKAKDNRIALPGQLFYSSEIPVCLWLLAKKNADGKRGFRDRRRHNLVFESCIRCNSHPNPWHN